MIGRMFTATVILAACASPARAQVVVVDPGNLAQAILIAERAWRHYEELQRQYRTILRMAEAAWQHGAVPHAANRSHTP